MLASSPTRADAAPARGWIRKVLRYTGGSAVATVCSEVAFLLLYGPLSVGTTWASVLGWLAGAIPNYWLNRSWTWERRGRPSLRGEILPYVAIILITLLIATVVTGWVHGLVEDSGASDTLRWVLVAGSFLGVYIVMFVLRFLLLDRLFARLSHAEKAQADGARTEGAHRPGAHLSTTTTDEETT